MGRADFDGASPGSPHKMLAQISANVLVWHGKISDGVYSAVVLATVAAGGEAEVNAAFARFKDLADRKSEIFDEDILALFGSDAAGAEHEPRERQPGGGQQQVPAAVPLPGGPEAAADEGAVIEEHQNRGHGGDFLGAGAKQAGEE